MTTPLILKIYAAAYKDQFITKVLAMLWEPNNEPLFVKLTRDQLLEAVSIGATLELLTRAEIDGAKPRKITVVNINGLVYFRLDTDDRVGDNLGDVPNC